MKTALLLCALTTTRLADTSDRKRVEQLERDAQGSGSLEAFAEVGAAFMQLYNADPQAPDADELLYNAAVSYQAEKRAAGPARTN